MSKSNNLELELLVSSPENRKYYFDNDFYSFCSYYFREYFTFETPEVLERIYDILEDGKNLFIE